MKRKVKKILPLMLAIVISLSSIGLTTSGVFYSEAAEIKKPAEISSVIVTTIKNIIVGDEKAEVQNKAAKQEPDAAAATGNNKIGIIDFFKNLFNTIKNFFNNLFSKKPVPTTTKTTTTTKKTTTTTKKTTTTAPASFLKYDTAFLNEAATSLNSARKSAGVANIKYDTGMAKAASIRAKEISTSFSHTRPNGSSYSTIYAECGMTKPFCVAENIICATKFDNAADIINEWLKSANHKSNIINSKYTRFGMAWYKSPDGTEYAVLLLASS